MDSSKVNLCENCEADSKLKKNMFKIRNEKQAELIGYSPEVIQPKIEIEMPNVQAPPSGATILQNIRENAKDPLVDALYTSL